MASPLTRALNRDSSLPAHAAGSISKGSIPTASPALSMPRLTKAACTHLIESEDIDTKVSGLGALVIGNLLDHKAFRKQRVFTRLSPSSHIRFLSLMLTSHINITESRASSYIKKWQDEFAHAPQVQQVDILNACAGRGLVSQIPTSELYSLLSSHYDEISPEILKEIAQQQSLFEINQNLSSLDIRCLGAFITDYRELFEQRLNSLPESEHKHLTTLYQCVFSCATLLNSLKPNQATLCRMVSCMPPDEVRELFTSDDSLTYFLRLNLRMAKKVLNEVAAHSEATLNLWIEKTPNSHTHLGLILEKFSIEIQREFFFKNDRGLKAAELRSLLAGFSPVHLQLLSQIDPELSLSSSEEGGSGTSEAVLSNLCEAQLIILAILPAYYPFLERHIDKLSEEALFFIALYSQNTSQIVRMLELCENDDGRWNQILKAASFITPKPVIILHLTNRIYTRCAALKEHMQPAIDHLRRFKEITHASIPSDATTVSEIFQKTQLETMRLHMRVRSLKSLESLCEDCSLPNLVKKTPPQHMSPTDWALLKESQVLSYEFGVEGSEWRRKALARSSHHEAAPASTLLSWMSGAESGETSEVVAIYESIRARLEGFNVSNERLGDLEYCYEDVLSSGLRGDRMQGVHDETSLVKHISTHQALAARSIQLEDISSLGYSLEQLISLGLSPSEMESAEISSKSSLVSWVNRRPLEMHLLTFPFSVEDIRTLKDTIQDAAAVGLTPADFTQAMTPSTFVEQVEKAKLTHALRERALSPVVLARFSLTIDGLYEKGLRLANLDSFGIVNIRSLFAYLEKK